jgi:hypothetical protein
MIIFRFQMSGVETRNGKRNEKKRICKIAVFCRKETKNILENDKRNVTERYLKKRNWNKKKPYDEKKKCRICARRPSIQNT